MITSTSNAKVKELVQLQKKSKARSKAKKFVVEGIRMVKETPRDRLEALYISESFWNKYGNPIEGDFAEVLSDKVFAYVSDTKTPQGILAVVRQIEYDVKEMIQGQDAHILILDNLQDPGNLGTIFRTAEAAGVTGILLSMGCADIYNPKTIRSTMGSLYRMPFAYVEEFIETIQEVKKNGIKVFAAHLEGKNSYDQEDYRKGSAFLIGNEGNGLRQEVADCADVRIRIPMQGQVESLNAAIAATVLMFEVSRQRRWS